MHNISLILKFGTFFFFKIHLRICFMITKVFSPQGQVNLKTNPWPGSLSVKFLKIVHENLKIVCEIMKIVLKLENRPRDSENRLRDSENRLKVRKSQRDSENGLRNPKKKRLRLTGKRETGSQAPGFFPSLLGEAAKPRSIFYICSHFVPTLYFLFAEWRKIECSGDGQCGHRDCGQRNRSLTKPRGLVQKCLYRRFKINNF